VEDLRVLNRRQTIDLVGVSTKTWERLESLGDTPIKTRLSEGRVGYRLDHIKEWLDRRVIETSEQTGRSAA
jgi:predicted DNA-binding transcriptional regulator AlpA